ncbi:MAG: lytic transglycosylase domain-containing protein [Paracoccaceae bacterium]
MTAISRRAALGFLSLALAACGRAAPASVEASSNAGPKEINRLISRYAKHYHIPESLLHRVVKRESGYNPAARNGPYYGLMQILPQTARTMGYDGPANGLLDAETNLKYGAKYLRGAWLVSGKNPDKAVMWYSKGYYYEAKRLGLLKETGLKS